MKHLFDIRAVLMARHAQHVVLIHFPIALFLTGVLVDLLFRLTPDPRLAAAADVNFAVAAISVYPAFLTGILAWRYVLDGQRLHGVLLYHLSAASATALLITGAWWLR